MRQSAGASHMSRRRVTLARKSRTKRRMQRTIIRPKMAQLEAESAVSRKDSQLAGRWRRHITPQAADLRPQPPSTPALATNLFRKCFDLRKLTLVLFDEPCHLALGLVELARGAVDVRVDVVQHPAERGPMSAVVRGTADRRVALTRSGPLLPGPSPSPVLEASRPRPICWSGFGPAGSSITAN